MQEAHSCRGTHGLGCCTKQALHAVCTWVRGGRGRGRPGGGRGRRGGWAGRWWGSGGPAGRRRGGSVGRRWGGGWRRRRRSGGRGRGGGGRRRRRGCNGGRRVRGVGGASRAAAAHEAHVLHAALVDDVPLGGHQGAEAGAVLAAQPAGVVDVGAQGANGRCGDSTKQ